MCSWKKIELKYVYTFFEPLQRIAPIFYFPLPKCHEIFKRSLSALRQLTKNNLNIAAQDSNEEKRNEPMCHVCYVQLTQILHEKRE